MGERDQVRRAFVAACCVCGMVALLTSNSYHSIQTSFDAEDQSTQDSLNPARAKQVSSLANIAEQSFHKLEQGDKILNGDIDGWRREDSEKLLTQILAMEQIRICEEWKPNSVISSTAHCTISGIARISTAFEIENCGAALRSIENRVMVDQKIRLLSRGSVFRFFRGSASLFAYNMMCNDPDWNDKVVPKVISNGDTHPENFGVMYMANRKLIVSSSSSF